METNQKLVLDDLIETVLHLNKKNPAFGGVLKITSSGVSLSTRDNIWGMGTAWANSEQDLKDMLAWVKDQFKRSSSDRAGVTWTRQEPNEEIRDLENDIKRGIK